MSAWTPPELPNILLRHSSCNDEVAYSAINANIDEAVANSIETALRHHISIRLQKILWNLNSTKQYKIIIGGGRASELYINPILQNILYQKKLYEFSYDYDLVAYQNTAAANEMWKPWGDFNDSHSVNSHPALNDIYDAIKLEYRDEFVRRELISHLSNLNIHNRYDLVAFNTSLSNGSCFWKHTWIPAGKSQRLWQIKFSIPHVKANVYMKTTYDDFECIDMKNGISTSDLYQNPTGTIYETSGKIRFASKPDSWFLRPFFWEKAGYSDWSSISIQKIVVDPFVLYREQVALVGSQEDSKEILGNAEFTRLDKELRKLGLSLLPNPGQIDVSQKDFFKSTPLQQAKYKKRLVRLYCLYTMISQLLRLERDKSYSVKLGGAKMSISVTRYFQFFSRVPFFDTKWKLKEISDSENTKASGYKLFGKPFPYLKVAFENKLIIWYSINEGEEKLSTIPGHTPMMKLFNTTIAKSKLYCPNEYALAARRLTSFLTYQQHINSWILAGDAWRRNFHSAIYVYLETTRYNRATFWGNLYGLDGTYSNFIQNTFSASHPEAELVKKDVKVSAYRFGFPMNVLFKQGGSTPTRLGLADTLPVGQVIYTGAYLSTTMKTNGKLDLESYKNVQKTGHTLYEFELQGDGFLYFTYDEKSTMYRSETEIFIPVWTKFYIKSKRWKYIANIKNELGDSILNYKLVFVVTFTQIPEDMNSYKKDIGYHPRVDVVKELPAPEAAAPKAAAPKAAAPKAAAAAAPKAVAAAVPKAAAAVPKAPKLQVAPPAVPMLPSGPLPPGYDFSRASTDTGVPFETNYTASLQTDYTLEGETLLGADGFALYNSIDRWIDTNFPFEEESPYAVYAIQGINGFFKTIGRAHENNRPSFPEFFNTSGLPEIIHTEGDGTCLVHALLMCLSRRYRYHPNKSLVGRAYRQHQMIKFAKTYGQLKYYMRTSNYLESSNYEDFQEKHKINIFIHHYQFNTLTSGTGWLYSTYTPTSRVLNYPGRPAIVLLNETPVHYSACRYKNPLLSDSAIEQITDLLYYTGSSPGPGGIQIPARIGYRYPAERSAASPLSVTIGAAAVAAAAVEETDTSDLIVVEPSRIVINRKPTPNDLAKIRAELAGVRLQFEKSLGSSSVPFHIRYPTPELDGFFCALCMGHNNIASYLQTTYAQQFGTYTNMFHPAIQSTIRDIAAAINSIETWKLEGTKVYDTWALTYTHTPQTLDVFTTMYAFVKRYFNFLDEYINLPESTQILYSQVPGFTKFVSGEEAVMMYIMLQNLDILSRIFNQYSATEKFTTYTFPPPGEGEIPFLTTNLSNNIFGPIKFYADSKYGYAWPPFNTAQDEQLKTYTVWEAAITEYLKMLLIFNNIVVSGGGGSYRHKYTRRHKRSAGKPTRKLNPKG
jgi:hypothetical protein